MTEKPLRAVEKVKEESHGLRGDLAPQLAAGGDHFSDASAQLLKFHGTYQQEDRDQRRERRGTDSEPGHQFMVRCTSFTARIVAFRSPLSTPWNWVPRRVVTPSVALP